MRAGSRSGRSTFLAILLAASPGAVRAAEWALEPSISAHAEYNDNVFLSPQDRTSAWGFSIAPGVKFSGSTETFNVTGIVNFRVNRWEGAEELNATDYTVGLQSTYRLERDIFGIDLNLVRDSTLVSELAETGVAQARRQRSYHTVRPEWTRRITERSSLAVSVSYADVDYDDTAGTQLIDYRQYAPVVTWRTNVNERNQLAISAFYDTFKTRPASFEATTAGVDISHEYLHSETLRWTFGVGARHSNTSVASNALVCDGTIILSICFGTIRVVTSVIEESDWTYTLKAGVEKRGEVDVFTARISRDLVPSALGSLVETDRVEIGWSRELSAYWTFRIDGSAYRSKYVGGVVTDSDSSYYRVDPKLTWRFGEGWVMDFGYSYSRQKYGTAAVASRANVIYLNLGYAWPRMSMSR